MPYAPPGSRAPRNSVTARPAAAAARQLPSGQAAAPAQPQGGLAPQGGRVLGTPVKPAAQQAAGVGRQRHGALGGGHVVDVERRGLGQPQPGPGQQREQQHASQAYRSTSSRLSTLPDGPSGIASTNSTFRGYLYLAIRSFDQVMIADPSSSSLPSASGARTTTAQTSSPSCGSGTAITATCATASWRSSTSSTSRG